MMHDSPLKYGLVAYLAVAFALLLWQVYARDFLGDCEFNAGSCAAVLKDYSVQALLWPRHLILWKAL